MSREQDKLEYTGLEISEEANTAVATFKGVFWKGLEAVMRSVGGQ